MAAGHEGRFMTVNESERLFVLAQKLIEPCLIHQVFTLQRVRIAIHAAVLIQTDDQSWRLNRIKGEILFTIRRMRRERVSARKHLSPYAGRVLNRFSIVTI